MDKNRGILTFAGFILHNSEVVDWFGENPAMGLCRKEGEMPPRKYLLFPILVMCLILTVLGCSSDDPSGPTEEEPADTPTPEDGAPTWTPTWTPTSVPDVPTATPTPYTPPGDFPAFYEGMYYFNTLPWAGAIAFVITSETEISGTWEGEDIYGDQWSLSLTGYIDNGTLYLSISGYYSLIPCAVSGTVTGYSSDGYESFDGSWSLTECHNLGFRGTWWAVQVW